MRAHHGLADGSADGFTDQCPHGRAYGCTNVCTLGCAECGTHGNPDTGPDAAPVR